MIRALLTLLALAGCDAQYDYAQDVATRPDPHALLDCEFDAVGDGWEQVGCSPVFSSLDADAQAWERGAIDTFDIEQVEIFGVPFFQMWYSGRSDDSAGHDIGTAASWNGVDWTRHPWNPVVQRGSTDSFDRDDASVACVAWDSEFAIFHLWYQGTNGTGLGTTLGHATSTDGVFWTDDLLNPINPLSNSGSRLSRVMSCDAVYEEGGLHLWASGLRFPEGQLLTPEDAAARAQYVIAHLRTEDGAIFDVSEPLVIEPRVAEENANGTNPDPLADAFDANGVHHPTVFAYGDPDEPRWWMLYAGYEELTVANNPVGPGVVVEPALSRLGLATSNEANGGWERQAAGDGLLPLDFSGADTADRPRASYVNGRLYTFFADQMPDPIDGRLLPGIGLAISDFPPGQSEEE